MGKAGGGEGRKGKEKERERKKRRAIGIYSENPHIPCRQFIVITRRLIAMRRIKRGITIVAPST